MRLFSIFSLVFNLDIGQRSGGKHKLIESSKEGAHEGVGFGDVNLSRVVDVELGPGSGEELGHVRLHLGLRDLLGHEKDLGASLLAALLVEDLAAGLSSSGVGDWDGVVVEDVVHDVVLISTKVSGGRSVSGSGWRVFLLLLSLEVDGINLLNVGGSEKSCKHQKAGVLHFFYIFDYKNKQ